MGTTVAANALLERSGAPCALLITKGFGDLLRIGKQNRPKLFDLNIRMPEPLYETVIEVDERIRVLSPLEDPGDVSFVRGLAGDLVEILRAPDLHRIRQDLQRSPTSFRSRPSTRSRSLFHPLRLLHCPQ